MYVVRGSELNDFLRCRLRWRWAWLDGLRSKKPNNKLFFGTAFHKFLEDLYNREPWSLEDHINGFLDIPADDMDDVEYQEMLDTLAKVATNYWNTYCQVDFTNWETVATELTFAIPLDDEIGYTGTIDLIVRDKRDSKIYLIDHKTTSSIDKYDKNSDMDRQISRYWWALQQLTEGKGLIKVDDGREWITAIDWDWEHPRFNLKNVEIGGFIYNIILRDYPVPPKVLKNGSLSKDKSQKTTFDMYFEALESKGLISISDGEPRSWPVEYDEIMDYLDQSPKEFFRRIQVIRNQAEIDSAMTELYATALDMKRTKRIVDYDNEFQSSRSSPIYRNITTNCPWDCQFFDLCKATLDGSNADFLIDSIYTREETGNER